ncbi:hypothetical protein BC936DRAFT_137954 [Jimgerdemannia flammicorona]|uniref:Uncharacterized protein n=1 Tax=Jimgerdemannia flammicorona TaxID=994334 RepID=A0A433CW37_9FUNG|nr:hypothetical protein BC936DRAFT_137954 [Jimgerdemannia flammicorona]
MILIGKYFQTHLIRPKCFLLGRKVPFGALIYTHQPESLPVTLLSRRRHPLHNLRQEYALSSEEAQPAYGYVAIFLDVENGRRRQEVFEEYVRGETKCVLPKRYRPSRTYSTSPRTLGGRTLLGFVCTALAEVVPAVDWIERMRSPLPHWVRMLVKDFKVRDKVFGLMGGGGYASYAILNHDLHIPDTPTFQQATAIAHIHPEGPLDPFLRLLLDEYSPATLTSCIGLVHDLPNPALHRRPPRGPGRADLCGSGIGMVAIPLARLARLTVSSLPAGSDEKAKLTESLGAMTGFN